MASATAIELTKQFNYRGDPAEQWSNKYWLTGQPPTTPIDWATLIDELLLLEVTCYSAGSRVVGAIAWNDDSPGAQSVYTRDFVAEGITHVGTLSPLNGFLMAGDQAGMFQIKTARKSTRGKPIYLRKYVHDGYVSTADTDTLSADTSAAYTAFAGHLFNGTSLGGRLLRSQKQIEQLVEALVDPWVTTRTLKRRGKRP